MGRFAGELPARESVAALLASAPKDTAPQAAPRKLVLTGDEIRSHPGFGDPAVKCSQIARDLGLAGDAGSKRVWDVRRAARKAAGTAAATTIEAAPVVEVSTEPAPASTTGHHKLTNDVIRAHARFADSTYSCAQIGRDLGVTDKSGSKRVWNARAASGVVMQAPRAYTAYDALERRLVTVQGEVTVLRAEVARLRAGLEALIVGLGGGQ